MQKRYAIYEGIANGDDFTRFIDAKTEKEAINEAEGEWNHMSKYDQGRRLYFDLALSSSDADDENVPESDYTPIRSWV